MDWFHDLLITHVAAAGSWDSWTRPRMSDSVELERGEGACLLHWAWPWSRDCVTLSSGVKWRKLGMGAVVTTGELTTDGGGRVRAGGAVTENSEDRKSCSTLVTSGSSFRQSFETELCCCWGCSLSLG